MPLTAERCVACRRDAPTVTDAEAAELHTEIPDWEVVEIEGVRRLRRVFAFDDFARALAFTNMIGTSPKRKDIIPPFSPNGAACP